MNGVHPAWEAYVGQGLPAPSAADRVRIEAAGGGGVPDAYWATMQAHQGQVLRGVELEVDGQGAVGFGVLLLGLAPEAAGEDASYCVETCLANMRDYHPAGLLPFADDTGGNYWAFDFRGGGAEPAIALIDHEIEGDDGVFPVASDFAALMARAGV